MEIMKTLTIGGNTYEIADEKMRKALEEGGVITKVETTVDSLTGKVSNKFMLSNGETFTVSDGASGVYVGSGTPPANATVWINPNGDPTGTEDWEFDLDDGSTDTKTVVVIDSDDATANGTLAILRFKQADGTWSEIPAIKGEKGDEGNGIESITLNDDYTLTIKFTDGTSHTTESIRGEKGDNGNDGVSITKVEQTTTSSEDGGSNVITVTLSDNNTFAFTVMNGSKGSKGDKGDKGDTGAQGAQGEKGEAYTLTDADKSEIAEAVKASLISVLSGSATPTADQGEDGDIYLVTE